MEKIKSFTVVNFLIIFSSLFLDWVTFYLLLLDLLVNVKEKRRKCTVEQADKTIATSYKVLLSLENTVRVLQMNWEWRT